MHCGTLPRASRTAASYPRRPTDSRKRLSDEAHDREGEPDSQRQRPERAPTKERVAGSRHFSGAGGCVCDGMTGEGAGGPSAAAGCVGGWLCNIANRAPINNNIEITRIIATTIVRRRRATAPASAALACFSAGRILGSVQRGSRAIKRVAIERESGSVNGWSGSVRINESNLRVAASADIAARPAASCQGSRSCRASSDTTLSGMPLRSSPIGENRKTLNSEPRRGAGAEVLISFAKTRCLRQTGRPLSSSSVRDGVHACTGICLAEGTSCLASLTSSISSNRTR